jgi:lactate dehydrogenase-like 2-hydroxyacid dehydrogenase
VRDRGPPSPAAELTWALILALLRHVPAEDARLRAGGCHVTSGTSARFYTDAVEDMAAFERGAPVRAPVRSGARAPVSGGLA